VKKICKNCKWWVRFPVHKNIGNCSSIHYKEKGRYSIDEMKSDDILIPETYDKFVFVVTGKKYGCIKWISEEVIT
jgi:hypothetical protein